jgi:hypothetical protein
MSDWGISVKGMHNVADASPLQFIRKISESDAALDSGSSKTFDFSGSVPAGTTLVVWTDIAVAVLESSSQLPYRVLPINIAVSGLKVTISLESYGTGGWIFPTPRRPTGFWVFGVYGQPARGDWGAWINQGGAYPAVVNSDAGMFLTQKITPFSGGFMAAWYRTGTIAISGKTVTGSGTNWTDNKFGIGTGQALLVPADGDVKIYEIARVDSATQLTLSADAGSVAAGSEYAILSFYTDSTPDFARRLSAHQSLDGYYQITAPDDTPVTMDGWQTSDGK